jgi:WD40 repeat protein
MSEFKEQLGKLSRQERLLALETLPGHLAQSTQGEKLYQLLTDFDFIEAKLDLLGVQPLIEDYDLAVNSDVLLSPEQTEILKLMQGAIRKSARVLDKDKTQLARQLLGRLLDIEMPVIQELLKQVKDGLWLWPLWAKLERAGDLKRAENLERAGEGCLPTLTGHTKSVTAVAIAPSGLIAVSASDDNTLKVWDLLSGNEIDSFSAGGGFNGCAISPDGMISFPVASELLAKIRTRRKPKSLQYYCR